MPTSLRESPYDSPVLSELRLATKTRHQILDKAMPLAKADADWSDYIHHLQLLSAWLIPLEQWLSNFHDGPQGSAPHVIRYSDIIQIDLAEADQAPHLPSTPASWMRSGDPAYRWGIAYVIEGSQLGGDFLYKKLSNRLAPHKLRYLQQKRPGRWGTFLQSLAGSVTTPEQISMACSGASDAFDALLCELHPQSKPIL